MESFVDQLAEDVIFNSPVATYRGRDDVVHLLMIISGVVEGYAVDRELSGRGERVTFVTGRITGEAVDGVVDSRFNDQREITELTLMLRPLRALLAGVELMGQALAASPLPSTR
jgi:hypothetical protein